MQTMSTLKRLSWTIVSVPQLGTFVSLNFVSSKEMKTTKTAIEHRKKYLDSSRVRFFDNRWCAFKILQC
jgi:hypothetical protein